MPASSLYSIFLAILSTVILLLCHLAASRSLSCNWSFLSCKEESRIHLGLGRQCMVTIVLRRNYGIRPICQPRRQKTFKLPVQYYNYCDLRTCTIRPSWCAWAGWIGSDDRCGPDSGKKRRVRQLCCHPVTGERLTCSTLSSFKQFEHKSVDWSSCSGPKKDKDGHQIDTFVWIATGVVSSVVVTVCIVVLLYCLKFRRAQINRNRSGRRVRSSQRRAVPSAPAERTSYCSPRFPTECAGSGQVVDHNADQLPPSYEETLSDANENTPALPPPQYDAALKLAI